MVSPLDLSQDHDIRNENEAIAEDETKVGRESEQIEELLILFPLSLGRF